MSQPFPFPASRSQTFAIFCALKIDVRNCELSKDAASDILTRANADASSKAAVHVEVAAMAGAIVKGLTSPTIAKAITISKPTFASIWEDAWQAGVAAATVRIPTPMVVTERANPLDDSSPVVQRYAPIEAGVCGFAWVNIKGNTAFGKWAAQQGKARKGYPTGLNIWISDYDQSMERKEAHAYAMAKRLCTHGITAYAGSRMD